MSKRDNFPSSEQVERIRRWYPVGTRLRLLTMDDPYSVPPGTEGTVTCVDDMGQVGMNWDNGRSLSLIPGVDSFEVIERAKVIPTVKKKRSGDAR